MSTNNADDYLGRCPHGYGLGARCPSTFCGDGSGSGIVVESDLMRSVMAAREAARAAPSARLTRACHALVVDTYGDHPFTDALEAVITLHETQPPVGPTPGPVPGVCATCGNTGLVHGPGQNGNWTNDPCGCQDEYCGGCGEIEPCGTKRAIADALKIDLDAAPPT